MTSTPINKELGIPSAMRELSADIASLETITDELIGRLGPIISVGKQIGQTSNPPSGSCDLATEINSQIQRITAVRMALLDLKDRIEL